MTLLRRPHQRFVVSLMSVFLCFTTCVHCVAGAALSVSVNPSIGQDILECNVILPCQSIEYAIHARRATDVLLSDGTFYENVIVVNSSVPLLKISGSRGAAVFDCSRRLSRGTGPAFVVTNASVSISGITFQNCVNFNSSSGTGGAISAYNSSVAVTYCAFVNNTAQTGGAIGAVASALTVNLTVFENNTATCSNTTTACSAWGGAIGAVEMTLVELTNNSFSHNTVNLELIGVKDRKSRAAGGGGCVSVMYNAHVHGIRVVVEGNAFQSCSVLMSGSNLNTNPTGVQYGNTFGGAVSLYYGLGLTSFLHVKSVTSSFINNRCYGCSIIANVGIGGSSYGGCLSVYAGAWNVGTASSSVVVSVFVENMRMNISSNNVENCSASITIHQVASSVLSHGANAYGGGISLVVGAYSYIVSTGSFSSSATVSNSSYIISSNIMKFCAASSSTRGPSSSFGSSSTTSSHGSNVYGGGISLVLGAYSYIASGGLVNGSTTVISSSYTISSNLITFCSASSSTSGISSSTTTSYGANVYGGAISIVVGAYSYVLGNRGSVNGSTTVINSSHTISSNAIASCAASSFISGASFSSSFAQSNSLGTNAYGGGISLVVGAYTHIASGGSVNGSTTVVTSSYVISSNTMNFCTALSSTSISFATSFSISFSRGSNVYGGGISLVLGTHSFIASNDYFSGSTALSNSNYNISSNEMISCTASSSTSSSLSTTSSNGANVFGGGISLVVGAYTYFISEGSVYGNTTFSNSGCTISSNKMTSCIASTSASSSESSSSNGANAHGGGISFFVGAYSYIRLTGSVNGSTTVSNSSHTISRNSVSFCTASTSASSLNSSPNSHGANAHGGGISLVAGAYTYITSTGFISGSTAVSNSTYAISSNAMTSCTALSSTSTSSSDSFGQSRSNSANVYGGGISLVIGASSLASITGSGSTVSGSTAVSSSSSYTFSNNTMTSCTASSSTSSSFSSSFSFGANAYGGGISLVVGAYTYLLTTGSVNGSTTVSKSSCAISSNTMSSCAALSSTSGSSLSSFSSSKGANVYGGAISLAVGAYSYFVASGDSVDSSTAVSSSSYTISSNTMTSCSVWSSTSGSSSSTDSNGANAYGGGFSLAVGAYTHILDKYGSVNGSTTVSSSSYTISNNSVTSCTASSSTTSLPSSPSSFSRGSNVYGGGISLVLGAYSYVKLDLVGFFESVFISEVSVDVLNSSIHNCSCDSVSSGISNEAFSFGGAISTIFEAYVYPNRNPHSRTSHAIAQFSFLNILRCNFSRSFASSSPNACSPGASSAGGGALFISVLDADAFISHFLVYNAAVRTRCATSSSVTFSLGGGLAIFRAGRVVIDSTNFTLCAAGGVPLANNVIVSGGGIFIQDSHAVTLRNTFISASSVKDALSVQFACGGSALGMKNVSVVRISNSQFYDNSDSSLSGVVLLQQLESGMVVNITDASVLSTDPSFSVFLPALNISCGYNCPFEQQQRLRLNLVNSTLLAEHETGQLYQSSMVMSLPRRMHVSAANSFVNCSFNEAESMAVLGKHDANRSISLFCAPCARPFFIATTSRSMNLNNFPSFAEQTRNLDSCRSLQLRLSGSNSDKEQQCPFGVSFCSTIANVTVGFWTNFTADGNIIDAIRCPSKYCGCRNIQGYSGSSCQLFPPFAAEFQPEDALCNGNRTGVLCGGCKQNFTQSLNGYSCVHNDICSEWLPLVWTVTVIGYFVYSVYIVISSLRKSSGLIMCVLFYGQLSSFSSLPSQLDDSGNSAWFSIVSQFGSVLSLWDVSCYGVNMGAYQATAAQLCGPAVVLAVSLLLAAAAQWLLPRFSDFLQKREISIQVSFSATTICVLQLLFSSVTQVVFQLITCQDVDPGKNDRRVFIDGRQKCEGHLHNFLIAVAALLSLVPLAFLALLKFNKIPATAKSKICSAFTSSRDYWGALTLIFRFVMTTIFSTVRVFPSISALALLICSLTMMVLLIMLRPYVSRRTFHMDIFCNFCLIIQFALQILVTNSESLGFAVGSANIFRQSLGQAAAASNVLRYIPFLVCALLFVLDVAPYWLRMLGSNVGRSVRRRFTTNADVEMQPDSEDLKSSIL